LITEALYDERAKSVLVSICKIVAGYKYDTKVHVYEITDVVHM